MTPITITRLTRVTLALLMFMLVADSVPLAQRRGGNVRSSSRTSVNRTSVNRNTNVDRSVNVNRDVNVNRNIDVDRDFDRDVDIDVDRHGCCYGGGWGAAAAVATTAAVTAAVVGSRVYALPPSCSAVVVNEFTYQQCGSTWYQPQLAGGSTTYVVVNPPL